MSRKKGDDGVFSFTLIDLLVQIIFLGIFVFAVETESASSDKKENEVMKKKLAELQEGAGKYKDLNDRLTALSPHYMELIKELQEKKAKGGLDKPSCLSSADGKVQTLANLRLVDDRIEVIENNPNLELVLKDLGHKFESVRTMSPTKFKQVFGGIRKYKSDCVFYMGLCERSKNLDLRDTVEQLFYKKSCDQKYRKTASVQ